MFAMQLKKIPHILFAIFYLTLSTHLSASIHFCGGSITGISFFEHNSDDKCECNKLSDNSCCDDLTFQFKTSENSTNLLKQINLNFTQKIYNPVLSYFHKVYLLNEVYKTQTFYIFNNKPPYNLLHLNAIFLRI